MALFRKKKDDAGDARTGAAVTPKKSGASVARPSAHFAPSKTGREHTHLIRPWFSEKALIGTEKGVYAFEVPKTTTKRDVARAVALIYKVAPQKVRIVNLPAKKVPLRGRRGSGTRPARRKAYVFLKKGETLNLA